MTFVLILVNQNWFFSGISLVLIFLVISVDYDFLCLFLFSFFECKILNVQPYCKCKIQKHAPPSFERRHRVSHSFKLLATILYHAPVVRFRRAVLSLRVI